MQRGKKREPVKAVKVAAAEEEDKQDQVEKIDGDFMAEAAENQSTAAT